MNSVFKKPELRMITVITGYKDGKKAADILEAHKTPIQYLCKGEGTASNELMDYLGLGTTEKAILFGVTLKSHTPEILAALESELKFNKRGKGIAFTFPISGTNMFVMQLLSEDIKNKIMEYMEGSEIHMTNDNMHSLLIATVNQGYSEEIVTVAKDAGAVGGTVLHARRLGPDEPLKKWGINVQPEKEIIFILAEREKKLAIMKAIGVKYGLHSEAQGIVISVPVDDVAGLDC